MRFARLAFAPIVASLLGGCGSDEHESKPRDGGKPDANQGCGAGETTREDGSCQPAGVPPEACGQGFESDETGGCRAVMPEAPCPKGQMAIPGETACRPVAPCGSGTWGDIPVEASTEYVNAAYAGADSDGSEGKPWKTIQEGIDAATPGAIVAVAAGSYTSISLYGKKARVWGKCPAEVEIVGAATEASAVDLGYAYAGTELHDLAVTGKTRGLIVSGYKGSVLERVWFHDTTLMGVVVTPELDDTDLTMRGCLVESTQDIGIVAQGAAVYVEDSVVRAIKTKAGEYGRGIEVDVYPMGAPGTGSIVGSVVEQSGESAIFLSGSTLTMDRTLVRDTAGRGVDVNDDPSIKARASATIKASVIERSIQMGIFVGGSDLAVESTVVRDVAVMDQKLGRGINLQFDPISGERPVATVKTSLIERCHDIGISVASSDATVEATLVRDTTPEADQNYGDGIVAIGDQMDATMTVTRCRVESSATAGIASFGATAQLEGSRMECNAIDLNSEFFLRDGITKVEGVFHDLGGNACGCAGQDVACEVKGVNLNAPIPPESM